MRPTGLHIALTQKRYWYLW